MVIRRKSSPRDRNPGWAVAIHPALRATRFRPHASSILLMIRIAISLAAYQAIASAMLEGTARPPESLEVGEGVGLWLDPRTLAVLRMVRMAGEGYSDTILRLFEVR